MIKSMFCRLARRNQAARGTTRKGRLSNARANRLRAGRNLNGADEVTLSAQRNGRGGRERANVTVREDKRDRPGPARDGKWAWPALAGVFSTLHTRASCFDEPRGSLRLTRKLTHGRDRLFPSLGAAAVRVQRPHVKDGDEQVAIRGCAGARRCAVEMSG